jgi:uncharacterized Tic20 family protein
MAIETKLSEEHLLAALAHALIVTGAIGPVAGLLIYITQKEKSTYTARQALQAIFYQLTGLIVLIVIWSCWGVFYALTFIPLITNAEQYQEAPPPIFWIGLGSMILPLVVMGIWGLYGLYGAVQVWLGKDFHYAFIGRLKILN